MDIEQFEAGKASGVSKILVHENGVVLVTWPSGFDPRTGKPLPVNERGYLLETITEQREACAQSVKSAEEALAKAKSHCAAFDALIAEAKPLVDKARAAITADSKDAMPSVSVK